jgi:ferredoxin-NADP reductase
MEYRLKIMSVEEENPQITRFIVVRPQDLKFIPGRRLMVSINKPGLEYDKRALPVTSLNTDYYLEFMVKEWKYDRFSENLKKVKAGEELIVSESVGSMEYSGRGIFFAMGDGILPLFSIFRHLKKEGLIQNNKLVYVSKSKDELILERELRHLFGNNCIIFLHRENLGGYKFGRIDEQFVEQIAREDFSQTCYLSGSEEFIKETEEIVRRVGMKKIISEVI